MRIIGAKKALIMSQSKINCKNAPLDIIATSRDPSLGEKDVHEISKKYPGLS